MTSGVGTRSLVNQPRRIHHFISSLVALLPIANPLDDNCEVRWVGSMAAWRLVGVTSPDTFSLSRFDSVQKERHVDIGGVYLCKLGVFESY